MTFPRACGAVLLAGLGAVVSAQRGQGAPPPQPTFRATTTYVALDVLVTDRADRPITGLTKADFRITQGGKPQEIADFEYVSIPVENHPIDMAAPVPPASDIASNAASSAESRAIAIVVDDTVLNPEDIVWIKRVLAAMLATLSPADQVAFTYVRRSDLGQDFTNDAARHARSVVQLNNALGLPGVSEKFPVRDLLVTLDNVARTLKSARQSRRIIVLFGTRGCVPYGPSEIAPVCKGVIDRANQSGVTIYAIDPTGGIDSPLEDPLATLAIATGGRRYRQAEPWLSPARLMAENGSYYLLGYYPQPLRTDGKFQEVDVTVNRPGAVVRARKGYASAAANARPLTAHRAMTATLGEGLPDPGLPIRAFVAPLAPGLRGTTRATVTIEVAYPVPPGGFSGNFNDEWRVGILALDADGKTKASFQRPVTFTGTWLPSATGSFVVNEVIDVPSQPLTFRIGVTSRTLGKTGTAHIQMEVPDYRDRELRVSPLVLGVAKNAIDAAVGLDRLRPLVPFQPATRRSFSAAESLRVFGHISWRSSATHADVEMSIAGGAVQEPQRFSIHGADSAVRNLEAAFDRTLPLQGLQPGTYILRVVVTLPEGNPVVRQVPFTITAAASPRSAAPRALADPSSANRDSLTPHGIRERDPGPSAPPRIRD
jgi:VWFA-related protein